MHAAQPIHHLPSLHLESRDLEGTRARLVGLAVVVLELVIQRRVVSYDADGSIFTGEGELVVQRLIVEHSVHATDRAGEGGEGDLAAVFGKGDEEGFTNILVGPERIELRVKKRFSKGGSVHDYYKDLL